MTPFSASVNANTGAAAFTPVTVSVSQHGGALPQQSLSDGALMVGSKPLSRVASGAERYPETVEALRDVGRLRERHNTLETRVELLEAGKADQAQLQHLRELLTDMGKITMWRLDSVWLFYVCFY